MSVAVATNRKRVTFENKILADVGDGTEWPLEVTLDQLAEILYRVKDAAFDSGGLISFDTGSGTTTLFIDYPPDENSQRYFSDEITGDIMQSARGYFAESAAIAAPFSDYFGDAYTPSYGATEARDIGDNERGIWVPPEEVTWGTEAPEGALNHSPVGWGTAFSHLFSSYAFTTGSFTGYGLYTDGPSSPNPSLSLSTFMEVAWVGTDILDSSTRYFLKVLFRVFFEADEVITSIDTGTSAGNLNFQLSIDVLTIPLYVTAYGATISAAIDSDFTISAFQWWPYAKPGGDVWDTATGEKL